MMRRIVAAALLAGMCLAIAAPSAMAGAKTGVVRLCIPADTKQEVKVVVETDDDQAWLGVSISDITDEVRNKFDLGKDVSGVYITEVHEGSPAEAAGLEDGDVILSLASKKISSVKDLVSAIDDRKPGDDIDMTVLRDGSEQLMMAKLGTRPEEYYIDSSSLAKSLEGLKGLAVLGDMALPWLEIGLSGAGGRGRLGVYINDMSDGLAEYFEVPDGEGALVEDVVKGSAADEAGIKAGDVIVRIDGDKVTDRASLVEAIAEMETDAKTPIVLIRKGKEITVTAVVGESEYDKAMKEYELSVRAQAEELSKAARSKAIIMTGESREQLEKELAELRAELKEMKEELKKLKED